MKWFLKFILNVFRKKIMALDEYRTESGDLNPEIITEAYVLLDYENKPICICVLVNGAWVTFSPFDEKLDADLKKILKGGKYTDRYLSALIKIQDEFEEDILERRTLLNNSKTLRN